MIGWVLVISCLELYRIAISATADYDAEKQIRRIQKDLNRRGHLPHLQLKTKLGEILAYISVGDISNIINTPPGGFMLQSPMRQADTTGIFDYLMNPTVTGGSTEFEYQKLPSPVGEWLVTSVRSTNTAIVQCQRRPSLPFIVRMKECMLGLRLIGAGFLRMSEAAANIVPHPLVRDFAFLMLLRGQGIAVRPYYITPPMRVSNHNFRRFSITKFYPGGTLEDFISRTPTRPVPILLALQIGQQVFELLSRIHSQGITHGNVSVKTLILRGSGDLRKGLLLSDFSRATLDARGLDETALADLRMFYSILIELNVVFAECINQRKVQAEERHNGLVVLLEKIYTETNKKFIVRDVDYYLIQQSIKQAVLLMSSI